jgi:hypothetical protein
MSDAEFETDGDNSMSLDGEDENMFEDENESQEQDLEGFIDYSMDEDEGNSVASHRLHSSILSRQSGGSLSHAIAERRNKGSKHLTATPRNADTNSQRSHSQRFGDTPDMRSQRSGNSSSNIGSQSGRQKHKTPTSRNKSNGSVSSKTNNRMDDGDTLSQMSASDMTPTMHRQRSSAHNPKRRLVSTSTPDQRSVRSFGSGNATRPPAKKRTKRKEVGNERLGVEDYATAQLRSLEAQMHSALGNDAADHRIGGTGAIRQANGDQPMRPPARQRAAAPPTGGAFGAAVDGGGFEDYYAEDNPPVLGAITMMTEAETAAALHVMESMYLQWTQLNAADPTQTFNAASALVARAIHDHTRDIAQHHGAVAGDDVDEGYDAVEATLTCDSVNLTKDVLRNKLQINFAELYYRSRLPQEQKEEIRLQKLKTSHAINCYFNMINALVSSKKQSFDDEDTAYQQMLDQSSTKLRKKDMAKFKLILCNELRARGYRRGTLPCTLYCEQMLNGRMTRFWKPVMTFLQFINEISKHIEDHEGFMWITLNERSSHRQIVEHMTVCDDLQLPIVNPKQRLYGFKNGIYDGRTNVFFRYDVPNFASLFPTSVCVYNLFHRSIFPQRGFHPETGVYDKNLYMRYSEETNYEDRPELRPEGHYSFDDVKYLNNFMDAQEWEYRVRQWYCIAIGRSQGPIHDRFQFADMLLGPAGMGKSLALEQIVAMFPPEFQGAVMVNAEPVFGQSDFLDDMGRPLKHIAFCPDMDKVIAIDYNVLNTQVSAEPCVIAVKNKGVRRTDGPWRIPWWIAANGWFKVDSISQGGPLLRRWLIFGVSAQPTGESPTSQGILEAMGSFIKTTSLAWHEFKYRWALRKAAGKQDKYWIMDHVPQYFKDQRNTMAVLMHEMSEMFVSEDWFYQTGLETDILDLETIRYAWRAFKMKDGKAAKDIRVPHGAETREVLSLCFHGLQVRKVRPGDAPVYDSVTKNRVKDFFIRRYRFIADKTELILAVQPKSVATLLADVAADAARQSHSRNSVAAAAGGSHPMNVH